MPQTYLVVVEPITAGAPPPAVMPPIYYPPYLPTLPNPAPPVWGGGGQPMPPGYPVYPSHPIPPAVWPQPPLPGQPPGIWGGGNVPMPTPPIYIPGGGVIMPPMAPGGAPTHPITIPPGSWVMPPHVDNTLPTTPGVAPMPPIAPTPEPKR
jgi:hypothetical protein